MERRKQCLARRVMVDPDEDRTVGENDPVIRLLYPPVLKAAGVSAAL